MPRVLIPFPSDGCGDLLAQAAAQVAQDLITCGLWGQLEIVEECRVSMAARWPELSAPAMHAWATAAQLSGQLAKALVLYEGVLVEDPGRIGALANMGGILASQGRIDEAHVVLQQALKLEANHATALANTALVQQVCGNWRASLASLERAVRTKPSVSLHIRAAATGVAVHTSVADMLALRQRTFSHAQTAATLQASGRIQLDPFFEVEFSPFSLAYHGMNDVAHLQLFRDATLGPGRKVIGPPAKMPPQGEKVRVVFVSAHFTEEHIHGQLLQVSWHCNLELCEL